MTGPVQSWQTELERNNSTWQLCSARAVLCGGKWRQSSEGTGARPRCSTASRVSWQHGLHPSLPDCPSPCQWALGQGQAWPCHAPEPCPGTVPERCQAGGNGEGEWVMSPRGDVTALQNHCKVSCWATCWLPSVGSLPGLFANSYTLTVAFQFLEYFLQCCLLKYRVQKK